MRTRIEIINKANLLHEILNGTDIIIDYSYMCIEVVLTILKTFDIDIEKLNFPYLFEYIENAIPLGLKFLETIYVEAKRPIFYPDEHLDLSNKYLVKKNLM